MDVVYEWELYVFGNSCGLSCMWVGKHLNVVILMKTNFGYMSTLGDFFRMCGVIGKYHSSTNTINGGPIITIQIHRVTS